MKITWKRNGGPVSPRAKIDTRLDHQLSTLVIEEVLEDDSGEYSCEAHNTPGILAHSTVNININAKGKLNNMVTDFFLYVYRGVNCQGGLFQEKMKN